jgi:hypothetical protein
MTFGEEWGWGRRRTRKASHVELGFPHDFYTRDMVKGILYGGLADKV